ncbi:MAG: hypothetical protein AAF755_14115 [Pseudomonadota bacterium]
MRFVFFSVFFSMLSAVAWAQDNCDLYDGGIALCDIPTTWFKNAPSSEEDRATYLIDGGTYAILSFGPGAQSPTAAIELALAAAARKFNVSVSQIERGNMGATNIDGIPAVFVDYLVPVNDARLFYRTTTAWSPNLTLRLTTYGFEDVLANNFDQLHEKLVASTRLLQ